MSDKSKVRLPRCRGADALVPKNTYQGKVPVIVCAHFQVPRGVAVASRHLAASQVGGSLPTRRLDRRPLSSTVGKMTPTAS